MPIVEPVIGEVPIVEPVTDAVAIVDPVTGGWFWLWIRFKAFIVSAVNPALLSVTISLIDNDISFSPFL